MARVTVEDCVDKVPNRFELVMLAAHRAGESQSGARISIDRDNDKNPVVALREILVEVQRIELAAVFRGQARLGAEEGTDRAVAHIQGVPLELAVTSLRTVQDADDLLKACAAGARCVCIGGGLLGLETAGALARRGAQVTLLEGHGWLLPRQLNQRAGEILGAHAGGLGITLRNKAATREILGEGHVRGVLLEDGSTIPAELVVIATGIRSNCALAQQAGLEVKHGVLVNNQLITSHPDVLAAGDVAEHNGVVYGLWTASQAQGAIAGRNLAGAGDEFTGLPRTNTLKVLGLDLFSMGVTTAEDGSYRAVEEERGDAYFRFLFHDGRLAGAILLGDMAPMPAVKQAIETRTDLSVLLARRPGRAHLFAR